MKLSIVIPIYNSSKFQSLLLESIEKERILNSWQLEVIFVDDGSRDNSYELAIENSKRYSFLKVIQLSRNFGHQSAVRTGLNFVTGDIVAIIDDDLQDPPSVLPGFIKKINEGWDVVYGIRRKRKESFIKKTCYHAFYRILSWLSDIDIPLDTGDFCVMKRQVVQEMLSLPEKNPFLRGMRAWVGFKQMGMEYDRAARVAGDSGYTFKKLFKLAFDGIFSFSLLPLKAILMIGCIGLVVSVSYATYILAKFFSNGIEVKGFTTLALLISFFSSLILICLGIIGEYISRIYTESKNRPITVINRTHRIIMIKCWVLGGNGLVGQSLKDWSSSQKDIEYVFLSRSDFELGNKLPEIKEGEIVVDLIPCPAPRVHPNMDRLEYHRQFTEPHLKMLEGLKQIKIKKLVFLSSGGTVYGKSKDNEIFKENHELKPISTYGESKLKQEQLVSTFKSFVILRPSNIFNSNINSKIQRGVIGTFLQKFRAHDKIEIFGNIEIEKDYISSKDMAQAIHLACLSPNNGIFNIGSGETTSLSEIINAFEKTFQYVIEKIEHPYFENDVLHFRLDISSARDKLGFGPKDKVVEWILSLKDKIK